MKHPKVFRNFTLSIHASGQGVYSADLVEESFGNGRCLFSLPFTRSEFEAWKRGRRLDVGVHRDPEQAQGILEDLREHEVGSLLFETLFQGDLLTRFKVAVADLGVTEGLRIRLKTHWDAFDEMQAFCELPWEMMQDRTHPVPLVLDPRYSLVRYLEHEEPPEQLPLPHPLRVLVVACRPDDQDPWDRAACLKSLACRGDRAANIQFDLLAEPTLAGMRAHLLEKPCHVLLFIGHGGLLHDEWIVCFEREDGKSDPVSGRRLAMQTAGVQDLKLVALVSCESATARGGRRDPFVGMAHALCGRNLPAVVAMQMPIAVGAALTWLDLFFARLGKGDPLDEALDEARLALVGDHGLAWMTPVLYLRNADAVVFQKPRVQRVVLNTVQPLGRKQEQVMRQDGFEVLSLTDHFRRRTDGEYSREPVSPEAMAGVLKELHDLQHGLDPEQPVHFEGRAGLSLWFALGYVFRYTSRFTIGYRQYNKATNKLELWHAAGSTEGATPKTQVEEGDGHSRVLVVSVSVAQDTRPQVRRHLHEQGVLFRRWLDFSPQAGRGTGMLWSPTDGQSMAQKIAAEIRAATSSGFFEEIHVFLCCPSGLALLTAWHLSSVGSIRVYDYLNPGYFSAFYLGR